jgi:HlyD family secretion protein
MKRVLTWLLGVGVLVGVGWALWPGAVGVEVGMVGRGGMEVVVVAEGRTRVKDRYVVSAPLAGRLGRIGLKPGDRVEMSRTVLAVLAATPVELLNARSRAEAEARERAAGAAVSQAGSMREQAVIRRDFALRERERIAETVPGGGASQADLESAEQRERTAAEGVRAAEFGWRVAEFEWAQARAALEFTDPTREGSGDAARFEIRSPIDGVVFRVFESSDTVVTPGEPLLELADPAQLEVEADALTADAVGLRVGTAVQVRSWGGEGALPARVRVVEPSAFMKVSALGIEEQRVHVICDFTGPPEPRQSLGDGYKVDAAFVVWEGKDVVQVPVGSLFRSRGAWSVFVIEAGRARERVVELGPRNDSVAAVLSGLAPGQSVVLYPDDQIRDRCRVQSR